MQTQPQDASADLSPVTTSDLPDVTTSAGGPRDVTSAVLQLPEKSQALTRAWLAARVAEMKAAGERDRVIPDSIEPTLKLRIRIAPKRRTVSASYTTRSWTDGRGSTYRRFRIGSPDVMSLAQARDKTRKYRAAVKLGEDPQAQRTEEKSCPTVQTVYEEWLNAVDVGPKTKKEYVSYLTRFFLPAFAHIRVKKISQYQLRQILNPIGNGTEEESARPSAANFLKRAVSSLYSYAIEQGYTTVNPAAGIKNYGSKNAKTRYLKDHELRTLWNVWESENSLGSIILQVMLLTGQRGAEVRTMRHSEIEGEWWVQGSNKTQNRTGKIHTVYLHPKVRELIDRAKQLTGNPSDFVFSS